MVEWWWGVAAAALPVAAAQQLWRKSRTSSSSSPSSSSSAALSSPSSSSSSPSSSPSSFLSSSSPPSPSPSSSPSSPSSSTQSSLPSDQKSGMDDGGGINNVFFCERVCTSKRMLNKVGAFAKDPNPSNTCVTVCGASQLDACSDACARSVCSNQHHIPNWNDVCLRRCQNQCLHLQSSAS